MNHDCSLMPPTDQEILSLNLIGIHEAAFWITDWPQKNDELYYPDPTKPFEKGKYGVIFDAALRDLEKAIEEHKLYAKTSRAIKGVVHGVKPVDVLVWALRKGYILPERLQKTLKLYQFSDSQRCKAKNPLKAKIIFQLIFAENPEFAGLDQFFGHPLIYELEYYQDLKERKALKRYLEEAVNFKASRGAQTTKQPLKLLEIKDIIRRERGRILYNFPSLEILFNAVCNAILSKAGEELDAEELFKKAQGHSVLKLHIKQAPDFIHKVLWKICVERFPCEVFFFK